MPTLNRKDKTSNDNLMGRKPKTLNIKEDTSKMLSDYSKNLNKTQSFVIEQLIENYLDKLYDDILDNDMKDIQTRINNKPQASI